MKLKITLSSEKKIVVPKGYSEYLQALIYKFLDRISSEWLHDTGFKYNKRAFKMFCYSWFLEKPKYDRKKGLFIFPNKVSFFISSPVDWIIKQVGQNIMLTENVRVGQNNTYVSGIEILPLKKLTSNKIKITTLTPIEVHTTPANRTIYYNPGDYKFGEEVNNNLKRKWKAFYQEDCPYNLKFEPSKNSEYKKQVLIVKNTVVEGYSGTFSIEGEPEFLELGLLSGLGSRNSGGFGMVEVV